MLSETTSSKKTWSSREGKAPKSLLPRFTIKFSYSYFSSYSSHQMFARFQTQTPTDPSHTRGRAEVSEPLRNEWRWHSELYNVWSNMKFVSPMYKHTPKPPFCYGTVYIRIWSREASRILQNSGMFFNIIHSQHLMAKHSYVSVSRQKQTWFLQSQCASVQLSEK